jgi:hypothetical protein
VIARERVSAPHVARFPARFDVRVREVRGVRDPRALVKEPCEATEKRRPEVARLRLRMYPCRL